ncbi:MAG: hypothetical protein HYW45_00920 [Candidatus Daviesbacteria bacterium]|nr:MAG: hypothetical protein HYW45_00920 [Candidatus Daviesbacteria bacterium]
MNDIAYTLNPQLIDVKINKDLQDNQLLSLYEVNKICRKVITSQDIFNKELNLQEKYKGYIANFIFEEVKKLNT